MKLINPHTTTLSQARKTLLDLYYDGWFDLQAGSIVFDFLTWNGGKRSFTHLGYAWRLPYHGVAEKTSILQSISLDYYNFERDGALTRVVCEVLVVILLVVFVVIEILKVRVERGGSGFVFHSGEGDHQYVGALYNFSPRRHLHRCTVHI